jgi:hypothetical protein
MNTSEAMRQFHERRPITTGPTAQAIEDYRAAVWEAVESGSGQVPEKVLSDAWKIQPEAQRDMQTYRGRIAQRKVLDVDAPALLQRASAAKAAADRAKNLPALPLTLGIEAIVEELRATEEALDTFKISRALGYANLPFPPMNVSQLVAAIASHEGGSVMRLAAGAGEMKIRAENTLQAAQRGLSQTAAPEIRAKIDGLRSQIEQIEGRIRGRAELLNIGNEVAKCERRCQRLAKGERPDDQPGTVRVAGTPQYLGDQSDVPTAELYRRERVKLDHLHALAERVPEAIAENAADAAEAAQLREKLPALIEEMLIPRMMAWA